MSTKSILITNATGNQGTAVIDALVGQPGFTLLAATRDSTSRKAQALQSKGNNVVLVQGHLDDVPALFASARQASPTGQVWGVFSLQLSMGKGVTHEGEIRQGKALVDEGRKAGVTHFVYSSVDRGGDEKSWENPTSVQHFQSKHEIEHYLRDHADGMGWTVLRPVAFMDGLNPDFASQVFIAALRDTLGSKPMQWVATSDIGMFAKFAFEKPGDWNNQAIGLAGDELTHQQLSDVFLRTTGRALDGTFGILGRVLKYMVSDMGAMMNWFASDGYGANIARLRKIHPGMLDFEHWIRQSGRFPTV